jgi:ABC-2 type transport system ATP-binding protein
LYCAESALSAVAPIEFEGVVKRFGARTVLDDLSFEVPEGTVVGLLGPNGAGKSTAMRCLLGLQKPNAGHARILGREAGQAGFREATRSAGVIIEAPPLYKNATAIENLAIRVASIGLSTKDAQVREILNRVGMADRADDKVGSFSLGMRQRVGIALALVGDPTIVVLDEPTNGLHPEARSRSAISFAHCPNAARPRFCAPIAWPRSKPPATTSSSCRTAA